MSRVAEEPSARDQRGERRGPAQGGATIASVLAECDRQGLRLGPLRQRLLELLWQAGRPLGAYDLLAGLQQDNGHALAPTSVYRALKFLMMHGFVRRIESRNAFLPSIGNGRPFASMYLLCKACGRVAEIETERVEQIVRQQAASIGFEVARPVIEIEGICHDCLITKQRTAKRSSSGAS